MISRKSSGKIFTLIKLSLRALKRLIMFLCLLILVVIITFLLMEYGGGLFLDFGNEDEGYYDNSEIETGTENKSSDKYYDYEYEYDFENNEVSEGIIEIEEVKDACGEYKIPKVSVRITSVKVSE